MPLAAWRENSSRHVASLRRIRLLFFIAPVSSTITGRDYPQWTDLRKYVAELPVTYPRGSPVERHRPPLGTSRVASISLHTRAAVITPAEWLVAYVARFTIHVSLPLLCPKVGFRIILFGACSTFTARCGPRVRRVT